MRLYILTMVCLLAVTGLGAQTFINNSGTVQPNPVNVNLGLDNFVFGSPTLDFNTPIYNSRFFFNKQLSAFRAGFATQGYWDNANLGKFSFATGLKTTASGYASHAGGAQSVASGAVSFAHGALAIAGGHHSIALGQRSQATGIYAIAMSNEATASGFASIALGFQSKASANRSIALGGNANATGFNSIALAQATAKGVWSFASGLASANKDYSTAMGRSITNGVSSFAVGNQSQANGDHSTAIGEFNQADGENSFAANRQNVSKGYSSSVFGENNLADFDHEFVLGKYNDPGNYGGGQNNPLLVVGNGTTANARSNALAVLNNGDVIVTELHSALNTAPKARNVVVTPDGRLRVGQVGSSIIDTDDQNLIFNNNTRILEIEDGNSVTIPDNDNQTLDYDPASGSLTITGGNSVSLPLGNTGGGNNYLAGAGLTVTSNTFSANVTNGLRIHSSDNSIRLGGSLIEKTDVARNTYDMSFSGSGNFIVGSTETENQVGSADDTRMFFASNGAFRAGNVTGTEWDASAGNLGLFSVAMGELTIARGEHSTAIGLENEALGIASVSLGAGNKSTTMGAISIGRGNASLGETSITLGQGNTANGIRSMAMGHGNQASGTESSAIGSYNETRDDFAFAQGNQSIAFMKNAVAMGKFSHAEGRNSFSLGHFTRAKSFGEIVVGVNNTEYVPVGNDSWKQQDRLFVIGRGNTYQNRQDALIFYKNGNAIMAGSLSQSSDKRLKTKIEPLAGALASISKLNSYTYHWNKKANRTESLQHGVIAQELMEVYPELVTLDGEGYYAVNYSGLIPILMSAIKESKAERDEGLNKMQKEIDSLKSLLKDQVKKKN